MLDFRPREETPFQWLILPVSLAECHGRDRLGTLISQVECVCRVQRAELREEIERVSPVSVAVAVNDVQFPALGEDAEVRVFDARRELLELTATDDAQFRVAQHYQTRIEVLG